MTTSRPTLYGYYRSSTSYRLRILFNLKSVDYDTIAIGLDRAEQRSDEFLAINPMGALPVLKIDDLTLTQSPAIIDYIEERFGEPSLLPREPAQRQRVREICALVACDIHPVNNLRILKHLRTEHGFGDDQIGDWYRHWSEAAFAPLESMLSATQETPFAVGERLSLAEIYLIPQIYNARRFKLDMSAYPKLSLVDAHCQSLDAFAAAHPDRHTPE